MSASAPQTGCSRAEPEEVSALRASPPRAVRVVVVQAMDGHLTVCGPNDFSGGYDNAVDAALGWHIEAGHLPAAIYWVEVELPPVPTIPELRAQAERGEFPKSFVDEINADDEAGNQ